ncbi:hypothetical protein N7456_011210 [Penicillium angulare]|uniref:Major facilitator superfamily (MFS) profile domain-containing protein n=1 Tax=Penicillium angulare TaxID=116970 RepID=A0A9W9ETG8_9EURO|nr:hypothetical protein N7456_011210 [Penicillium angulare]
MDDYNRNSTTVFYEQRSSRWFIFMTIAIALFAETFLYGFLVPILEYMFQDRLHTDPSQTQMLTSAILGLHGLLAMLSGPIIGHFADKRPNHKFTLLCSLGFCILGTCMVAGARSVAILFIGRVIQGIAGSAVWIVGLATVANVISESNMGSVMGLMMSFANSGTICGPAISGLMIETTSYWVTWSIPLIVLVIDLVARLAMIERPIPDTKGDDIDDTTPLLPSIEEQTGSDSGHGRSFWRIILTDSCSLICLFITLTSSTVTTSFHATLPLYIEERFGWGPSTAGLLFAGLVVPGLIIGPLAGWTRDRVGARLPIMAGSIVQVGLLFMLGISGGSSNHSTSVPSWSKSVYIAAIIGIGAARPFVSGIAPAEMTAAIKLREKQTPGIFGSQGSTSRIFSLLDVAVSFGTMIGPVIGGPLKELAGWKYMNWTWKRTPKKLTPLTVALGRSLFYVYKGYYGRTGNKFARIMGTWQIYPHADKTIKTLRSDFSMGALVVPNGFVSTANSASMTLLEPENR